MRADPGRHTQRLRFLLLFFLPVALALLLGVAVNVIAEYQVEQARDQLKQTQQLDLQAASEASSISLQSLMLQHDLTDALGKAKAGRIDEAGAYQLHTHIVDKMADFEKRLEQLGQGSLAPAENQREARKAFLDFKRFVLMSTDLISIDTRLAGEYLINANEHYVALSLQLHAIDDQMTQRALDRSTEANQSLADFRQRLQLWSAVAVAALLVVWLLVANRLARRLNTLTDALATLSSDRGDAGTQPLFQHIETLATLRNSLIGEMARAVMAYRDTRHQRGMALAALETERGQLHALIQGMPDLVWLKDADGAYRVVNPRFVQQAGRPADEITGLHDRDLFPPEEAERYRQADLQAIRSGRYELPPHWRVFADGHRELIVAIKTPIYDQAGQLLGVLGVGRDITDLHQAQQALRDRERQYATIVSQAPVGIVLVDRATLGFISFNDAACGSLGYAREEFTELTLYDVQARFTRAEVDDIVLRIIAQKGMEFESQRRNKQGEVRDFWISMRPIELDGRECFTGVWMDITERKENERELHRYRGQLEQRVAERTLRLEEATQRLSAQALQLTSANGELRAIFDYATVGIVILQDQRIVRCNRKLDEIFGYPEEAQLGQHVQTWYPDETGYAAMQQLTQPQREARQTLSHEQELCRRDGSRFWARLTEAPIDTPEFPDAIIGIVEDVTEEHRIAEELLHAKDMAEGANRAKSSFVANMSHEIRTPMNAIIGLAHLIRRDPLNDRQKQQLDKLSAAAMHLLSVINDILDFSKIEAGKMTLDPTDFHLERVISNVFALISDKAEAKGLELVAEIGSLPRMLHGDGVRLGQVLLNFANNAVKFTDAGSVVLRGSEVSRSDGEVRLRFELCDTGIGLSAEQQEQLFTAFQQADLSTTRVYGGTGLGLAISRRLAELMGGQVGVSSTPGKGSTFWLEAPFGLCPDVADDTQELLPPRTRILVVDDMEEARESLADLLKALGARVDQVASGAMALESVAAADAQGAPYQMVFSDWLMPGLNGAQTCERIRQLPLRLQPVCILVSGSSGCPSDVTRNSTFAAFIPKPVLPAILADTIARTSGLARVPASAEQSGTLPSFEPGHRLLLAEDNAMNQEVALELLTDLGFVPDLAADGRQALTLAAEHAYELILMDVQMPIMDGLEATRRIRQLPGYAQTPILALTANAFAEDRAVALAAGMNDYIPKPVDPDNLIRTLAKWLPQACRSQPPADAHAPKEEDDLRQRLNLVDGLKVEAGLRSLRGDLNRLAHFLRRFAAEHTHEVETLRDEILRGDNTSAKRRAHTLKGLAATLGLDRIERLAQEAELNLTKPATDDSRQAIIGALSEALATACGSIHVHLGGSPAPSPAAARHVPPHPDLKAQLLHWRRQLATDDLDAADTHASLQAELQRCDPALAEALARAVDQFDFADALARLDAWLAHTDDAPPDHG